MADEHPDSIPATTEHQLGAVYDVGAALALHWPDTHPCGPNRGDPWLILHQDGGIEWATSLRDGARFLGVLPGIVGSAPVLDADLDLSALADACDDYYRAYWRRDSDTVPPAVIQAVRVALGQSGDHLAAENARLVAELERERALKAEVLDTDTLAIAALNGMIDQLARERDEARTKLRTAHKELGKLGNRLHHTRVELRAEKAENHNAQWRLRQNDTYGRRMLFHCRDLIRALNPDRPDGPFGKDMQHALATIAVLKSEAAASRPAIPADAVDRLETALDDAWGAGEGGGRYDSRKAASELLASWRVPAVGSDTDTTTDEDETTYVQYGQPWHDEMVNEGPDRHSLTCPANTDTTDVTWRAGDLALDRTDFVWWRDQQGWRPIARLNGSFVSDRDLGRFVGLLTGLTSLPPEMDKFGSVPAAVAARLRAVSAEQEGGDRG